MTKINGPVIVLSDLEVFALYNYFMKRAGYISYEHDLEIIRFIRKLNDYFDSYILITEDKENGGEK